MALRKQGKTVVEEPLDRTWTPTSAEQEAWEQQVLKIVQELDQKDCDTTTNMIKAGLDRNGQKATDYRQSLPPFLQAAAGGDLATLRAMVSSDVEGLFTTKDRNGSTAEHWAAGSGHLECLRFLVEEGKTQEPPTKMRRREGKTSLHYAARNGHLDCIRYLVEERGYSLRAASGDGTTPFHMACFGGNLAVVEYMLERESASIATEGNEWGCTAAHWMAMTKCTSVEVVRKMCSLLLSKGVSFVQVQKQGHSPLHKAAQVSISGDLR